MKLHQVRALEAVARSDSMQSAAHILNLSQPALSKAIRELERDLGVPLLVRSSRGSHLSPEGEALLPLCKAALAQLATIRHEAEQMRGRRDARLRVAVAPVSTGDALGQAFSSFCQRYPATRLFISEMRPASVLEEVRSGDADLGIVGSVAPLRGQGLQSRFLYPVEMILAASGAYRAERTGPRSLGELIDRDWMNFDPVADENGYLDQLLRAGGFGEPRNVIRCTSPTIGYEIAKRTSLMSCWSRYTLELTEKLSGADVMGRIEVTEAVPPVGVYLVYVDDALLTQRARSLVSILVNLASG